MRDSAQYRAAVDTAREQIDTEGRLDRDLTREAGAGTLLFDKSLGLDVPNDGLSKSDWDAVLETAAPGVLGNHGMSRTGAAINALWSMGSTPATVREHMRLHIKGIEDVILGTVKSTGEVGVGAVWQRLYGVGADGNFAGSTTGMTATAAPSPVAAPAPVASAPPAAPPIPSTPTAIEPPAVEPVPVASPAEALPLVDHAG